jgi:hypothetical protein
MPQKFDKPGVAFQYPDNWTIAEDDVLAGQRSVTVYSPGGAFWSVTVLPRSADPQQLGEAAVEAMKGEYGEEVEAYRASETIGPHELVGYDLNFCCMDLTNSAQVRCLIMGKKTYTIFCQGEDREFERIRLVFSAMTTSLIEELSSSGYWEGEKM